jgi:alkylation response protein AidB-like acyl-CoA dehydrogenase
MGIHANATCVMNYDGATGWLVGEEHKGLRAMFTMMNEARLGVGIQGLAQSEISYQNAADYARERIQGRSLSGDKEPEKAADPIIVHPDVRRMLMNQRAFNEAARALVIWTALKGDVARSTDDEKERAAADDHMGLMTPVIKGVMTDRVCQCGQRPADLWRPWLCRRVGHGTVCPRCPHCHDLRRCQRHSGARPGGPQAAQGWRPCHDDVLW